MRKILFRLEKQMSPEAEHMKLSWRNKKGETNQLTKQTNLFDYQLRNLSQ